MPADWPLHPAGSRGGCCLLQSLPPTADYRTNPLASVTTGEEADLQLGYESTTQIDLDDVVTLRAFQLTEWVPRVPGTWWDERGSGTAGTRGGSR